MENCTAFAGLDGFRPSCPGQNILKHVSVVDMQGYGVFANANNGDLEACLVYNCLTACVANAIVTVSKWNCVSDGSPIGASGRNWVPLLDYAFVNYAGGNIDITAASTLWFMGMSPLAVDIRNKRRLRFTTLPRIYSGAFDPWPANPAFLTGTSAIRAL